MPSLKLRLIFRPKSDIRCPKSGGLQKKKKVFADFETDFSEIRTFFCPKSGGFQKQKKKVFADFEIDFSEIQTFFCSKSGGLQTKKIRSSPLLRLIFRPKSLGLGWWGGMHPEIETDFLAEIVSFRLVGGMHPPLNPPLDTGASVFQKRKKQRSSKVFFRQKKGLQNIFSGDLQKRNTKKVFTNFQQSFWGFPTKFQGPKK